MSITYRRGTVADDVLDVMAHSLAEVNRRQLGPEAPAANPAVIRDHFRQLSDFDYLARTADQFWVAERDGAVVGYARAILHDGLRELTEFFVLPAEQSAGVGRELLARAFPAEGARHRTILASDDLRALARYLKSGVYPLFSTKTFRRAPEAVPVDTDLTFQPLVATVEILAVLAAVDRALLDYRRDTIHGFLSTNRSGYLYYRGADVVGYGYVGHGEQCGPFALLDATDFPAVLAHAESELARRGAASIRLQVPMINRAAVTHLLARGYRFAEDMLFCMGDAPFGKFEQYIVYNPPMFL
jgi:GNAT superfamily N-acetyltransferase